MKFFGYAFSSWPFLFITFPRLLSRSSLTFHLKVALWSYFEDVYALVFGLRVFALFNCSPILLLKRASMFSWLSVFSLIALFLKAYNINVFSLNIAVELQGPLHLHESWTKLIMILCLNFAFLVFLSSFSFVCSCTYSNFLSHTHTHTHTHVYTLHISIYFFSFVMSLFINLYQLGQLV